jgi:elongation factor P--beta-lysine ligase
MNQPTIIYSFPEEFSWLAKCKEGWCERFELYIFGIEIANAYTELTDPVLLEQRLKTYAKKMKELYSIELPIDHEFIEIHKDLPHLFTGISIGLERLFMLAINAKSLKVLF